MYNCFMMFQRIAFYSCTTLLYEWTEKSMNRSSNSRSLDGGMLQRFWK